jgi:hypothetical protein
MASGDKYLQVRMLSLGGEQDKVTWFPPLAELGMACFLFLIKSPRDNNYIHERENNLFD